MMDADVGITHLVLSTNSAMIVGMDQNTSEPFGTVPQASESFGSTHASTVKTENHTMTVREAARAFETAGVARTERSITNWCQFNRQGVSRLDCYYEENDHKYFITPQSVDRAVNEELSKARELGVLPNPSEPINEEKVEARERPVLPSQPEAVSQDTQAKLHELELKNRDLEIATRAKDMFIERLEKDREAFTEERQKLIDQLVLSSRQIGELETKLLQIEAPRQDRRNDAEGGIRDAETDPPASFTV